VREGRGVVKKVSVWGMKRENEERDNPRPAEREMGGKKEGRENFTSGRLSLNRRRGGNLVTATLCNKKEKLDKEENAQKREKGSKARYWVKNKLFPG